MSDEAAKKVLDVLHQAAEQLTDKMFIYGAMTIESSDEDGVFAQSIESEGGIPTKYYLFAEGDLTFDTIRYGQRDIGDATAPAEAAQIILTNMFYQTFDDDRVWTNEEWRAAIQQAARAFPAFDAILSAERTDWRNDDFAERVIAIRDR